MNLIKVAGVLSFLGLSAIANTVSSFRSAIVGTACESRWSDLNEFKLLFALPDFETAFRENQWALLDKPLRAWSTDLILKVILEIDQELLPECPVTSLAEFHRYLAVSYLERIGISAQKEKEKPESLVRAFPVHKDERELVREKLKNKKKGSTETYFGTSEKWRGIWILGASQQATEALKKAMIELWSFEENCRFFDPRSLYRVLVTPEEGVSAFTPELATLALSESLLKDRNLLHQVVLLHELTHAAIRGHWLKEHRDWRKEFALFSDWREEKGRLVAKVKRLEMTRKDILTELSKDSPFSLLPDSIYVGTGWFGVKPDGFVTGKSYRETNRQDDIAEDMADHVAVFHLFPERYCFEGKNIAPRKFAWIAEHVFPKAKAPVLSCK